MEPRFFSYHVAMPQKCFTDFNMKMEFFVTIVNNSLVEAFLLFLWTIISWCKKTLDLQFSFHWDGDGEIRGTIYTAQKMKFSIKDFFSKCDQIHSFLWIWSHLLKKSIMENFIFCAVSKPIKWFTIAAISMHFYWNIRYTGSVKDAC